MGCSEGIAAGATASGTAPGMSLKELSLEELMNLKVTSVSRTTEPYHEAAAALTVVTQEQLRRSGATSVPDALRGVPGLHAIRQSSSGWAISARGFTSVNSEKLLVQSDTRSIYTPLFSGVFWDVQDYLLADIERIEVIRGPGAALWGSNAVNGIINITTKHAADTHGTHLEASAGMDERLMLAARHGGQTAGGIHFRVFGKYLERDESFSASASRDDWRLGHLGFRADWSPQPQDELTVQGDLYDGDIGQLAPAVTIIGRPGPAGDLVAGVTGGNLLGRWRRAFATGSDLQFRAYYDRTRRNDPSFTDELDTIDFDFQHRFLLLPRHEIMWGLNYRYTDNRNEGKGIFAVQPATSQDHLYSAFVQDQISVRDRLRITLGSKFEHNDFSGFELQPSVRAAWDLAPNHTLWAAVSRAARIPTRLERDILIDAADPASNPLPRLVGNRDFEAEELIASELGYRWRAMSNLHVDVSLFDNRYEGLASLELGEPFVEAGGARTVLPVLSRNMTDGRSRGVEALITHNPLPRWRVSASYSYLDLELDPAGQDFNRGEFYEGATPRHQFALSSYLSLLDRFEFDAHFRRVGSIRRLPAIPNGEGIPGYSELDLVFTWHASLNTRVSIVGQNLLHDRHIEFGTPTERGAIERSVYAKVVWDF